MPSSSNKPLVLITGANQGLDYATTKILADSGKYHVILACRSMEDGEEAIAQLKSKNSQIDTALTPIVIDVTDDAGIETAKDLIEEKFGHLDILINSAGVNGQIPVRKPGRRENYQYVFEINVFGVAVMTQAFLPLLQASPYFDRRIVNVTTGPGQIGVAISKNYRSSKAALSMLTVVDEAQLKPEGIHVILVAPGHTATNFNANNGPKTPSQGAANIARAATEGNAAEMAGKLHAEELLEFGW